MPLVSMLGELIKAQAGGYALPCFDTFEMLGAEGVIQALEDGRSPGIVALYAQWIQKPNAPAFAALIRKLAEQSQAPVALLLDHGGSFEDCIRALACGCTDVMFDGSKLPLEENTATTRLVVRAAHAAGASVEAELGHVGTGAEYAEFGSLRKGFTDPDVAARFVEETGVDALAVAIGTAHGLYAGTPQIDLDLLQAIRRRVHVPLVMHGGSGLSTEQFQGAVACGITKINIFTDLGMTAAARVVQEAGAQGASYFTLTDALRDAFRQRCGYYVETFGSTGKA
ncbi:MAG: class II fructose-bisphosphate aldolase [Anaerolineae bacterium]